MSLTRSRQLSIALSFLLIGCFTALTPALRAQAPARAEVAVMLPLYLDSAFTGERYRHGNSIPGYLLPGLEFYNGVQLAADQLRAEGIQAGIRVLDSKKRTFYRDYQLDSLKPGLVIAVVQNAAELKAMTDMVKPTGAAFVSATLPNDGGVVDYPGMLLVNSTLKVHAQQLYKFVQRNHSIDNVLMLSPRGSAEERIRGYITETASASPGSKVTMSQKILPDTFAVAQILPMLDSMRQNVIIVPSLNKNFALRLIRTLSGLAPTYNCAVFGMPTWDELALNKPEFKSVDVYYSTPFVTQSGNAELYNQFVSRYRSLSSSRPSDMAFRGYELTYRFVRTYARYGKDFLAHVNDADQKLFADFQFAPVSTRAATGVDYHENQRVYFVKKTDGVIRTIL